MCEELEKCYGTDGTFVRVKYRTETGKTACIPEYYAYQAAKKRCTTPSYHGYHRYGGRGIEFRFKNFGEWWRVLGKRDSPAHSVDRINNDGNYEAGNLRWATREEQARNKPNVHKVIMTYKDGSIVNYESTHEAAFHSGICQSSISNLCRGAYLSVKGITASYACT